MPNTQTIRHSAYLDALGIEQYVSRGDLAGAAPSRRVVLPPPQAFTSQGKSGAVPVDTRQSEPPARQRPPERIGGFDSPTPDKRPSGAETASQSAPGSTAVQAAVQFSLAAIVAGPYLWLEEAPGGLVSREQVNLIRAMARALGTVGSKPQVVQFEWPLNNNRQLDQSATAASAALEGFVLRQAELQSCHAVILLGAISQQYLPEWTPQGLLVVKTSGTAQMQSEPGIKPQVWQDLRTLRRTPE